jgi:hypothetical protein
MITTQNKIKTKKSSGVFVISVMCAVILTIIRQSINNQPSTYANISPRDWSWDGVVHYSVDENSWAWFWAIFESVDPLIDRQKETVDGYLSSRWVVSISDNRSSSPVTNQTWNTWVVWMTWSVVSTVWSSEYILFENIKDSLSNQYCEYIIPIDVIDMKIKPSLYRWLEHCLITVSASGKMYPDNILTHEMMRTIAQRAWFVTKMEYASDRQVSREQFLTFVYALQQHHQIANLPVIWVSDPVKRNEYIIFLYKMFEWVSDPNTPKTTKIIPNNEWPSLWQSLSVISWSTSVPNNQSGMTIAQFKQLLLSQGQQVAISSYDEVVTLTPEITNRILSDQWIIYSSWIVPHSLISKPNIWWSVIGVDKENMKQLLSRFIEKI